MMRNLIHRAILAAGAALCIAAPSATAQLMTPPFMKPPYLPPDSSSVTAVRAGWLIDSDAGTVLRDRVIIIRGSTITSIEPAPGHIPAGANVIDLSKHTVTPGLIDCHTHQIGAENTADNLLPLERSAAQETLDGVVHARRTLLAGFTTVMKEHGTYLVSDLVDGEYIRATGKAQGWPDEIMRKAAAIGELKHIGLRKAVAAGVKMAFGTDAGVYPNGENAQQFPLLIRYGGMTPMQVIQSATINAATLIGWQNVVGSIAPGKSADLVAVEGDGLADVGKFANVAFVMKSGTVYKSP